jgi:palmitoyltransferase ZDHHC2/15/20
MNKMDHHCPAIAGCVGFFNRKFFMLFLLYCIICSGIITFTMASRAWYSIRPILDYAYFFRHDLPVLLVYIICTGMFVSIASFFAFHVYLILNALTTIELREKITSKDPHVQRKSAIANLKYNRGPMCNWKDVFGSQWYIWLLPVQGDLGADANLQDGTYFYTKERKKRSPRTHDSNSRGEFSQPLLSPTIK